MDGEEDYVSKTGTSNRNKKYCNDVCSELDSESDWENNLNDEKRSDLGDMTFCMANFIKEAMRMMFIMRSHHMLTDVILEVGSELFHAHKVILAAASPYFKVNIQFQTIFNQMDLFKFK